MRICEPRTRTDPVVHVPVWVGKVAINLGTGLINHYAVKVGNRWFEVEGAGKKSNGPNVIVETVGDRSSIPYGVGAKAFAQPGTTDKSYHQIRMWNKIWQEKHAKYDFMRCNCQHYAKDLLLMLCGNEAARFVDDEAAIYADNATIAVGAVPGAAAGGIGAFVVADMVGAGTLTMVAAPVAGFVAGGALLFGVLWATIPRRCLDV